MMVLVCLVAGLYERQVFSITDRKHLIKLAR